MPFQSQPKTRHNKETKTMLNKFKKMFKRTVVYQSPDIAITSYRDSVIIADNLTRVIKQGRESHETGCWEWQVIARF